MGTPWQQPAAVESVDLSIRRLFASPASPCPHPEANLHPAHRALCEILTTPQDKSTQNTTHGATSALGSADELGAEKQLHAHDWPLAIEVHLRARARQQKVFRSGVAHTRRATTDAQGRAFCARASRPEGGHHGQRLACNLATPPLLNIFFLSAWCHACSGSSLPASVQSGAMLFLSNSRK